MRSPTLLLMRMKAAETSASSAMADCTPLAVVSRSVMTAEIDTFIKEVSTTRTNIAMASRSIRRRLPGTSGSEPWAGFCVMSPSRPPNGSQSSEVEGVRQSVEEDEEVGDEGGAHGVLVGELGLLASALCRRDEPVAAQGDPARRRQQRREPRPREVAVGRGLLPLVARREVGQRVGHRREDEAVAPVLAVAALAGDPRVVAPHESYEVSAFASLEAVAQRQRLDEPLAEPDVREHGLLEPAARHDERDVVEVVGEPTGRGGHTRGDEVDGIPEAAQQQGEETVELVAVTAAPGVDDLGQQRRVVEADRPAERDVEA